MLTPRDLSLPKKFSSFRDVQSDAIWKLYQSQKRFKVLTMPTGSGKSLTVMAYLLMSGSRAVVLTSTRALQNQYLQDFKVLNKRLAHEGGFRDVRGQSNYVCRAVPDGNTTVADGPCHFGVACDFRRKGGCDYYDAVRAAAGGRITITNYAFWMSANYFREDQFAEKFDTVVLDESHAAPDELAGFFSCHVSLQENRVYLRPTAVPTSADWPRWSARETASLAQKIEEMSKHKLTPTTHRHLTKMRDLWRRLSRLTGASRAGWTFEVTRAGWRWDPIWPAPYAEDCLFIGIPNVVLVSATVTTKTVQLLGVKKEEADIFEFDSSFEIESRPVYVVRSAPRITYRTQWPELQAWVRAMDDIMERRPDRKGLIHTVSYARAELIYKLSRNRHRLLKHTTRTTADTLIKFRTSAEPLVLLSPSMSTGVDFPMRQCEFQIISKVPFPDFRAAVLKARAKMDKEYNFYLAALELVQAAGRGMRSEDDQCETFIMDGNASWFVWIWRKFLPDWFQEALMPVRSHKVQPPPALVGPLAVPVAEATQIPSIEPAAWRFELS